MVILVLCGCMPRPQIPGEPAHCPLGWREEELTQDCYLYAHSSYESSVSLSPTGQSILSGLAREDSHVENMDSKLQQLLPSHPWLKFIESLLCTKSYDRHIAQVISFHSLVHFVKEMKLAPFCR